jgi:hypothetical protein
MVSPPASNMLKMQWNSEAAMQAQAWADNCVYKHNPQADRVTSRKSRYFMGIPNWLMQNRTLNFFRIWLWTKYCHEYTSN